MGKSLTGQPEDAGKNRSDTGGPAQGESPSEQEKSEEAGGRLALKCGAGKSFTEQGHDAKDRHGNATCGGQGKQVIAQDLSQQTG